MMTRLGTSRPADDRAHAARADRRNRRVGSRAGARPRGLKPAAREGAARGYVLLETVLATGLLILGLAVLGGQIQDSVTAVHMAELDAEAMTMAEAQLAMLDTGLITFDSVDEELEEEFGARFPDFGWRLTQTETATEGLFLLQLEILHIPHRIIDEHFDFDEAAVVQTYYLFRAAPRTLHLGEDFGVADDELEQLIEQLAVVGIDGLDPTALNPAVFAEMDFEELMNVLPTLMSAFGIQLSDIADQLPPDLLEAIESMGMEDMFGGGGEGDGAPDGGGG